MSETNTKSDSMLASELAGLLNKPGETHEVLNLSRLTSGASMETWSFTYNGQPLILRRLPGAAETEAATGLGHISIETEAEVIRFVREHGVCVPEIMAIIPPEHPLGRGFVMTYEPGVTQPNTIQNAPDFAGTRDAFIKICAAELAALHKIDPQKAPKGLPNVGAKELLQETRDFYENAGGKSVIFEIAFAWLTRHLPDPVPPRLLHADFRLGNLMFDPKRGLTAILDWETACLGDPARDIAYIAVPSWRFGHYANPVAGLGQWQDWLDAYQHETGQPVDPQRVKFWLVLNTLWWGVVCLRMVGFWRTGMDRSLERCMIGTRVSEVELDLLALLEDIDALSAPPLRWTLPDTQPTGGETQAEELSKAVAEWLTEEILPQQTGRTRFEVLVARNAQRILERHAQFGYIFKEQQNKRLLSIGLSSTMLLKQAHDGTLNLKNPDILWHIRLNALENLAIYQPKYPGFEYVLQKWEKADPI